MAEGVVPPVRTIWMMASFEPVSVSVTPAGLVVAVDCWRLPNVSSEAEDPVKESSHTAACQVADVVVVRVTVIVVAPLVEERQYARSVVRALLSVW